MFLHHCASNGVKAGDSASEESLKQEQSNIAPLPITSPFSSGTSSHPTDYMMSQTYFDGGPSMVCSLNLSITKLYIIVENDINIHTSSVLFRCMLHIHTWIHVMELLHSPIMGGKLWYEQFIRTKNIF